MGLGMEGECLFSVRAMNADLCLHVMKLFYLSPLFLS